MFTTLIVLQLVLFSFSRFRMFTTLIVLQLVLFSFSRLALAAFPVSSLNPCLIVQPLATVGAKTLHGAIGYCDE